MKKMRSLFILIAVLSLVSCSTFRKMKRDIDRAVTDSSTAKAEVYHYRNQTQQQFSETNERIGHVEQQCGIALQDVKNVKRELADWLHQGESGGFTIRPAP